MAVLLGVSHSCVFQDGLNCVHKLCHCCHRLTGQPSQSSYLVDSVVVRGHSSAVRTSPGTVNQAAATGVLLRGNVLVESYDSSTVVLGGHHAEVSSNLALGTVKDMTGA